MSRRFLSTPAGRVLAGAVIGAIAVFLITTQVQGIHVPHSTTVISNEVVYGLVVIAVLLAFDGGVWGALRSAGAMGARRRRRVTDRGPQPPPARPT